LTAYALRAGGYAELGTWQRGEIAEITAPFPIRIDVGALMPPPAP
jgi:hypothetical protein